MTAAETMDMELAYQIQKRLYESSLTAEVFAQQCGVPEELVEQAIQLVSGEISSVDEYKKPYSLGGKRYTTFEESVADLKNPNKDATYTPDTLLAGLDGFIDNFHKDFSWYSMPMCTVAYPAVNQEQFDYIKKRFAGVISTMEKLLQDIERSMICE